MITKSPQGTKVELFINKNEQKSNSYNYLFDSF